MEDRSYIRRLKHLELIESRFATEDISREASLADTKWFAYRFMSPWAATRRFLEVYQETFRRYFQMSIDRDRAVSTQGFNTNDLHNDKGRRLQLWRARQRADETGMRYEDYMEASFEFANGRRRDYFPQPNQLHHSKWPEPWARFRDKHWRDRLVGGAVELPTEPAYRIQHFKGLPAQTEYRQFAFALMDQRMQPWDQVMQSWWLQRQQIPEEMFAARIPADVYARAREALDSSERNFPTTPLPLPALMKDSLLQSCFGLPRATAVSRPACADCLVRSPCAKVAAEVVRSVTAEHGSAIPVDDEIRRDARERQRRSRAAQAARSSDSISFSTTR